MTFIPTQRPAAPWSDHNWWGQYDAPNGLPNVAGSSFQLGSKELQAGDMAYVESLNANFMCIDPATGAALWQQVEGGGVFPIQPQFVIDQVPGAGAGNITWNFAMGCEIRVLASGNGGTFTALSAKMGPGTLGVNPHSWVLRRSTVVGASAPALATYTDIIDSGTHSFAASDTWEALVTAALPHVVATDEWYTLMMWVGGGGQFESIAAMRSAGELNEDLAVLQGGLFVSQAGPPPGATPLPTGRSTTTCYGMTSIEVTPL